MEDALDDARRTMAHTNGQVNGKKNPRNFSLFLELSLVKVPTIENIPCIQYI